MQKLYIPFILVLFLFTSGCSLFVGDGNIQNIGLLLEGSIEDNAWNEKGYAGLLQLEKKYATDVFYEENVNTVEEITRAVNHFVQNGVNLIYGHSSIYGNYFEEIAENYPDVHFVYFNGGLSSENVTSLNFNAHAMGFFGGMVAGEMTKTNEVGIIAAFQWQPEIEGFYEGVKYANPVANVKMEFVNNWDNTNVAMEMYETMKNEGVDVFYPAGDAFSETMIQQIQKDGLYAVGYVSDQYEVGPDAVLTSTIQEVEVLYELSADLFHKGELKGEILTFDFEDGVIKLGKFHEDVPKAYQEYVEHKVEEYMETKLLPNEY